MKVWIHGGGQQGGGIRDPQFDGCNLAAHDTLLVSISYRLGPLGYLTLDSAGIGGNFGTQDLILGLEWVQSNIESFGGDPVSISHLVPKFFFFFLRTMLTITQQKKVLLFGESAGATNVFILSTLPKATSLFNAAIWESGAGPQLATPAVANTLGTTYANKLNCTGTDVSTPLSFPLSGVVREKGLTTYQVVDCLRSVSTTTLNATAPEGDFVIIYSGLNPIDFQPHVDGVTIPAQPWTVGPKVPMIFGSNSDEGGLFTLGTFGGLNISPTQYQTFLTENFGPAASIVSEQYPLTLPAFNKGNISPAFAAINTIITQAQFTCPAYQAMLKAQANNISVYTYLNSHAPNCQWTKSLPQEAIQAVGATHTSEISYVFGNGVNQPLFAGNGTCNFTTAEVAISESLIAAWTAMATTGNPSVPGGLQWPQWNNSTSMGVNIVDATTVGTVDYSQCQFWDMINNLYLNFTSSSVNTTSGGSSTSSSTGTATSKKNGAEKGVEAGVWGLTLTVGIAISVLMG